MRPCQHKCYFSSYHDGWVAIPPNVVGYPFLCFPEVIDFNHLTVINSAGGELVGARLESPAASAVLSKGREGDTGSGRGVDADAHVREVVNGVDFGDIIPHFGLELLGAVDSCAGYLGVDIRGHSRPEELFVGMIDRRRGAVADVGDGLALGQGWTGELDGKWGGRHCV